MNISHSSVVEAGGEGGAWIQVCASRSGSVGQQQEEESDAPLKT